MALPRTVLAQLRRERISSQFVAVFARLQDKSTAVPFCRLQEKRTGNPVRSALAPNTLRCAVDDLEEQCSAPI